MKFLFFFLFIDLVLGFYHRQGRYVDFSINQYATQLPSIHDITSSIIHYRVPIAVFVPSVRFHFRNDRKKNFFVLPSAKKSSNFVPLKNSAPVLNSSPSENNLEDDQLKTKNIESQNPNSLISRSGWTPKQQPRFKSLNQPAFILPIRYPTNRLNYGLNYASQLPMESNIDLIPFLYKDNLAHSNSYKKISNSKLQQKQPAMNQDNNYFLNNLPFIPNQPLDNKKIFNSNFDVLQPNTLVMAPIQTSPLLSAILPNSILPDSQSNNTAYNSTSSLNLEKQKNLKSNNSSLSSSANISLVETMPEQFDISQVSDNTFDGLQENVQNLEPVDANVPVNLSLENISSLNNNAPNSTDIDNKSIESRSSFLTNINQSKPINFKNNVSSNRVLRSLSLDTPSLAPLFAAAVSQSGHRIQHPSAFMNKLLYGENF